MASILPKPAAAQTNSQGVANLLPISSQLPAIVFGKAIDLSVLCLLIYSLLIAPICIEM